MLRFSAVGVSLGAENPDSIPGPELVVLEGVDTFGCSRQITCESNAALDARLECLASAPLLHNVTPAELREIAEDAHEMHFSSGETIFLQDDPVRHVLVVATGRVKVTQISEVGKEALLRVESSGCLIDDVTGVSQLHSLTARAMDPCSLLAWDAPVFEKYSEHIPVIQRNATAIMRARLRTLQERFCHVSTLRVPQRLAKLVISLAVEEQSGPSGPIVLSREELAQMAGTSLFTVSRLLSEWADLDILTVDRRTVVIEDMPRLQGIAEAA